MKRSIEDTPIVFIGAGNLATNLAKALYRKGFRIVQVYSRTMESARTLAEKVEAEYTTVGAYGRKHSDERLGRACRTLRSILSDADIQQTT